MLSGYKALSRRFVKSFPVFASGFEIETELTVHALELAMPTTEVPLPYRERPDGSESKLSTLAMASRSSGPSAACSVRNVPWPSSRRWRRSWWRWR